MPNRGRSKTRNAPARALAPSKAESPIASYRVADLPEIFTLYLDAVEFALHGTNAADVVAADDGSLRRKAGRIATWEPV